jgi:hypothetical protein
MNIRKLLTRLVATCLALLLGIGMTPISHAQTGCARDTWTEVPGFGVTNGSGPAAVVLGNDLYLYVTGGGDLVFTNVFTASSNSWSGWTEVPGDGRTGGDGPAAVMYRNDLYVFFLGPTGLIYVNRATAGRTWGGWTEVPGNGVGTKGLAAAVLAPIVRPDELELFVRGTDGRIYINTLTGTSWSGWTEVPGGGITTHGPAATAFGYLYLYVRGVGGGVFENVHAADTGAWSGWTELPGNGFTTAAPGAAAGHLNNALAVRGLEGYIFQTRAGQGSTNQWTVVPGDGRATATAGPALVFYNGLLHAFATGPLDRIFCSVIG